MSITYGFYNALNHDRKYNSVQMSKIFDGVIEDGIFMSIGNKFITTAGTGMTVIVGSGKAWFNHTWTENDSDLPVDMYPSEVVLNRIDALVLEVDSTDPVRANTIKFIKGTPSSTPVLPSITATTGIYRHILCSVYIAAGSTRITNANITNYVGTATTPFVSGVLETVSIDALLGQWQSDLDNFVSSETVDFDTWFDQIKDQLSVDAAGNLQLQINTLDSRLDSIGNEPVSFTAATTRALPLTGEHISILFGKIKKWFSDLDTRGILIDTLSGNYKLNPLDATLADGRYGVNSATAGTINLPTTPIKGYFEKRRYDNNSIRVQLFDNTSKKTWINVYNGSTWSGWDNINLGGEKFLTKRQAFIGNKEYRFIWGKSNGNYVRTNEIATPFARSEITAALTAITIEGVGTIALDYKDVTISPTGGLYLQCNTAGASGMELLTSNSCVGYVTITLI